MNENIIRTISSEMNRYLNNYQMSKLQEVLYKKVKIEKKEISNDEYVNKLLDVMETGVAMTTSELMEKLNMKSRISFRDNYLNPALENGLIKMTNPDKPTSKNQMYLKV